MTHTPYTIQLPNDVVSQGYRQIGRFEYAQVFHSPSHGFTGTEVEFCANGLGYKYRQIDRYTRRGIK